MPPFFPRIHLPIHRNFFRRKGRRYPQNTFFPRKKDIAGCLHPDKGAQRSCLMEKVLFSCMGKNLPDKPLFLSRLPYIRTGMQNKAASVVAHFGNIPLHTVTTKASFRYHQPKMGGFPAHPKGIYIGNIPSAENMGVASLPDTSVTVLIFILQRKPKPNIRQRSKKGLLRHILYGKYCCQYLSLPDTFADSLQLRRAKHLPVNKILPEPVHSIGLPRKHNFFHHTCFPAFPVLLILPLIVLPFPSLPVQAPESPVVSPYLPLLYSL